MFPTERVDEEERLSELPGFDQEAGAINFPCSRGFSHVYLPFGGGRMKKYFPLCDCRFSILVSPSRSLAAGVIVVG
jgi:hypothetical protein